jgi:hypothetical protein
MIRISKVTMTMPELETRQVRRLVRRYEQQGPIGLISRLRDRPSNRRLKSDAAEHAFGILRSTYPDFGPTLAAEKLRERHGVDLAVETVRSLMVAGGLWVARRLRAPKIQQQTLQDRLVKELMLQRISTVDGANEFMPTFIDDYNRRFGKLPRDRHDAHRAVRKDEDLEAIFAWREYRKVTDSLTLRYERNSNGSDRSSST